MKNQFVPGPTVSEVKTWLANLKRSFESNFSDVVESAPPPEIVAFGIPATDDNLEPDVYLNVFLNSAGAQGEEFINPLRSTPEEAFNGLAAAASGFLCGWGQGGRLLWRLAPDIKKYDNHDTGTVGFTGRMRFAVKADESGRRRI